MARPPVKYMGLAEILLVLLELQLLGGHIQETGHTDRGVHEEAHKLVAERLRLTLQDAIDDCRTRAIGALDTGSSERESVPHGESLKS